MIKEKNAALEHRMDDILSAMVRLREYLEDYVEFAAKIGLIHPDLSVLGDALNAFCNIENSEGTFSYEFQAGDPIEDFAAHVNKLYEGHKRNQVE